MARQYRDYGYWRRVVAHEHKGSINARYLAAPAALAINVLGLLGGFLWPPLWLAPGSYLVGITLGGLVIGRHEGPAVAARVPAVLATMHMSWGWGFVTSGRRSMPDDMAE